MQEPTITGAAAQPLPTPAPHTPGRGPRLRHWRHRLVISAYRTLKWSQRRLPPGVRSLLGIPLIVGGLLGILPILGFWMLPLGIALAVSDFPPLRRRLERWLNDTRRRYQISS